MPGDGAWLFELFFRVFDDGGLWLFRLWVLLMLVGLPTYVTVSLFKHRGLDAISRTLLVGLALLVPVLGPITASVLAGRARKRAREPLV